MIHITIHTTTIIITSMMHHNIITGLLVDSCVKATLSTEISQSSSSSYHTHHGSSSKTGTERVLNTAMTDG